ncbi:MAG: FAD-dependent oxidoreductase [Myxococcota bacterium]|nr:FAD-dependent oxidoreductase [Myxococcota bacterium]
MSSYDVVVVGGGHNGLVAASTLARKGRKVLVLEARDCFGGVAAGEEFAAGFRTRGLLHDTSRLAPELISGLQLTTRPPAPVLGVQDEGPGLLLHRDPQQSTAEIAEHRPEDAAGYRAWRARADRFGAVLRTLMEKAPFDFGIEAPLFPLFRAGLGLRRLGKRDMMDLLRGAPGRAEDWGR